MEIGISVKIWLFLLFLDMLRNVSMETVEQEQADKKLRHKKTLLQGHKGKYTTKEEIQRAPSEDHPCRLTRTSVQVSFPDMRSELFVDLLGYKESNLINLMRCKGRCDDGSAAAVECGSIVVRQKRVNMIIKTKLSGRDPQEKMKDLVLEEHVECGCMCRHASSLSCLGRFNNRTCECECEERDYMEQRLQCEMTKNTYWDTVSCQCRSKSVAPRGVDRYPGAECAGSSAADHYGAPDHEVALYGRDEVPSKLEIVSLVLLGSFLTVSLFLLASTFYYRRKVRCLLNKQPANNSGQEQQQQHSHTNHRHNNTTANHSDGVGADRWTLGGKTSKKTMATVASASSVADLNQRPALPFRSHYRASSAEILLVDDTVVDRYDLHGVKIETDYSDCDTMLHNGTR